METNINQMKVSVYGPLNAFEKNPLLSKGRVRIFYKGLNRNLTYIDETFAEKLIASLPYTPVSGIWDDDKGDFGGHGKDREAGRIYGLVPENPNVAWELHNDEDGVERLYCCADVVLFTSRYEHAADIVGKSQSMELYRKTLKGDWEVIDGTYCYKFTEGGFIGLQVLGDDTEPCFEGAAFYSYAKSLKEMVDLLKNYTNGSDIMDPVVEPVTEPVTEPTDPVVEPTEPVTEPTEPVAEPTDPVVEPATEPTEPVIEPTTEPTEPADPAAEPTEPVDKNAEKFEAIEAKFCTLSKENATLKGEVESLKAQFSEFLSKLGEKDVTISSLQQELEELQKFKCKADKQKKYSIVDKYSMLSTEIIDEFKSKIDEYSFDSLETALKIAYFDANENSIFENNPSTNHYTATHIDDDATSGAARLINKHKNNGGK